MGSRMNLGNPLGRRNYVSRKGLGCPGCELLVLRFPGGDLDGGSDILLRMSRVACSGPGEFPSTHMFYN